ncbi:hypothetical protein BGX28_000796 [Mortierella sp. GBA30]|nr:hypothetical protein BGX28_000796 [Mortierella sp. GBA30]
MVKLTLPLADNTDNEPAVNSTQPNCDPSQSIYDDRSCIKDFLFCSDDNPCPSKLPCIDRVCQCLPNKHSYITLTPDPVRMYTIGCRFDTKRVSNSCRNYEYGVGDTCLLNYCSSEVPCYAGRCDFQRHVCTNITSERQILPDSTNDIISLGDDPFGTHKPGISPALIILMAAGGIVALAVVGCIVRTATQWTKTSVAWASGTPKNDPNSDGDEKKGDENQRTTDESQQQNRAGGSPGGLGRMPSKFTGSHYMPNPPVLLSNEISPFNSPLPSPHFSPYSQPNASQVSSNNSLMNPFRHPINDSTTTIELHNRTAVDASFESLPLKEEVSETGRTPERSQSTLASTAVASAPTTRPSTPLTTNPNPRASQMTRSQTLSREHSSGLVAGDRSSTTTLQKSLSMQQLGSRPAPPPPTTTHSSSSLSPPPIIAVSLPQSNSRPVSGVILSQADMQGPSPSLDSLISGTVTVTTPMSAPLPTLHHQHSPSSPVLSTSASSSSLRSSFVLQSGAERHPSLTIPARQSMLKHSASVPQMVTPRQSQHLDQQLLSPVTRNLPAGFESSPTSSSRFNS